MSDNKDRLIRGFEYYLRGKVITTEEAKKYQDAIVELPLPFNVRGWMCEAIDRCVKPSSDRAGGRQVVITAQHAKDIIATVQFLKALHEADRVPSMPGPGIPTAAYCDELLEDLVQ